MDQRPLPKRLGSGEGRFAKPARPNHKRGSFRPLGGTV